MPTKYDPEYYSANKERHEDSMKRYYQVKRDERIAKQKAYSELHKEEIYERKKRKAHPHAALARMQMLQDLEQLLVTC
ncbi:hypothetical protein PR001_g28619 [Phytophthora rubi]|uniref:Uncharacterized protein n=2 Tax=Phytophthora rubi TaxID=129364 RepID=A0A6A3H9H7_9STRA|nr:hypothetical protein PR002_g28637 [Phytophthora rubi]KAE8965776.1 hypothetical protein PR001_g28619 [Phytophthora rubi]